MKLDQKTVDEFYKKYDAMYEDLKEKGRICRTDPEKAYDLCDNLIGGALMRLSKISENRPISGGDFLMVIMTIGDYFRGKDAEFIDLAVDLAEKDDENKN